MANLRLGTTHDIEILPSGLAETTESALESLATKIGGAPWVT
jgi:hypothetical protein